MREGREAERKREDGGREGEKERQRERERVRREDGGREGESEREIWVGRSFEGSKLSDL